MRASVNTKPLASRLTAIFPYQGSLYSPAYFSSGSDGLELVAVTPSDVSSLVTGQALDYVHTYKPAVFMPAHHDGARDQLWRATEPIFQALKDENPLLVTVSNGYREPVCFDVRVTTPRADAK